MAENPKKKQCVRGVGDLELAQSAGVSGTSASSANHISRSIAETNGDRDARKHIIVTAIMLDSSSSESEDEEILSHILSSRNNIYSTFMPYLIKKNKRNSVKQYMEQIVPSYSEEEFRRHFRISRQLYENLCQRLSNWDMLKNMRYDKRLPESAQMLVFLWFAGHQACSFSDLSDRFDMSLSSVGVIIKRVTMFLSSLSPEVIQWPSEEKKDVSSKFFTDKCAFPKAIGCIDGTHIVIDPPSTSEDDYIDRKGSTSICLQGICDENRKLIDIFIGYPGSCHDILVLKNSPIYDKLPSYCRDYYLLGDSAYPCNKYLITPYPDNGHLTRAQKQFNIKLSSGRECIEHTFGILKQRFRQLYYCKLRGIKEICHFIRACCVLHNIANENDLDFTTEISSEIDEEFPDHDQISQENSVRDEICNAIQNQMTDT